MTKEKKQNSSRLTQVESGFEPVSEPLDEVEVSSSKKSTPPAWLKIAQTRAEKCELKEAKAAYFLALGHSRKSGDLKAMMESLAGLLRLACEALDDEAIGKWEVELDRLMQGHSREIPPMAWYCKGALARHRRQWMQSQRYFHLYLRAARVESKSEDAVARGWVMLATVLQQRKCYRRSEWLAKEILRRYEFLNLRGVNGILSLVMGTLCETKMDFKSALKWFQKANAQFLGDHNWYYLLYVLYGYARIERRLCHYAQATWYLDLVDQAVTEPEFAFLRSEVALERSRLEQEEQDTMSLLIHGKPGALSPRRPQGMHDGPSSMVLIK